MCRCETVSSPTPTVAGTTQDPYHTAGRRGPGPRPRSCPVNSTLTLGAPVTEQKGLGENLGKNRTWGFRVSV